MMKITKGKLYAVLTGDVVGSTKMTASKREQLHNVLYVSSEKLIKSFPEAIPLRPELFRGDSWQAIIATPPLALRIALAYRALLKAGMKSKHIDIRISIGIGTIDFLPQQNPTSGDGEAFRLSGLGLDQMPKTHRMALSLPPQIDGNLSKALDVITKLIDSIAKKWTARQSLAIFGALQHYTQEEISEKVFKKFFQKSISQQAVSQHLDKANWDTISLALDYLENQIRTLSTSKVAFMD